MTNDQRRPTARILAFPKARRVPVGDGRTAPPAERQQAAQAAQADFGAWYHQAAVDEDRARGR